jgi:hypothetical protein
VEKKEKKNKINTSTTRRFFFNSFVCISYRFHDWLRRRWPRRRSDNIVTILYCVVSILFAVVVIRVSTTTHRAACCLHAVTINFIKLIILLAINVNINIMQQHWFSLMLSTFLDAYSFRRTNVTRESISISKSNFQRIVRILYSHRVYKYL